MALPKFTITDLMDAGVHFGHNKRRWNPSMREFIYTTKDNIHIIDLQKTAPMLYRAMLVAKEVASRGGKVLFVGTKKQSQAVIKEYAELSGQYYVNQKWLGGLLTNWKTVSKSLGRLLEIEKELADTENLGLTKKEILNLHRKQDKLESVFGGIKELGGKPDLIIVLDVRKEDLAIAEADVLNIPIIGICDTNADVKSVDFPVPGNDDAVKAITLYCSLFSKSIIDGLADQLKVSEKKAEAKRETKKEVKKSESVEVKTEVKVEEKTEAKK